MADMAPRAIEILRGADLVLAEDTRTTGILLRHFDLSVPLASHHKFNEHATCEFLASRIAAGKNVALVSDAGTPGISDPGFMLSRECRRLGVDVITLPGPTAFVPALVSSGLPCDRFVFEGFLPPKKGRASRIEILAADTRTFIIYESPLRLTKTLMQLAEACGPDRPASVSREISKIHETTVRGTLAELIDYFTTNIPRGEIVIVVQGQQDAAVRVHVNKYKTATE